MITLCNKSGRGWSGDDEDDYDGGRRVAQYTFLRAISICATVANSPPHSSHCQLCPLPICLRLISLSLQTAGLRSLRDNSYEHVRWIMWINFISNHLLYTNLHLLRFNPAFASRQWRWNSCSLPPCLVASEARGELTVYLALPVFQFCLRKSLWHSYPF